MDKFPPSTLRGCAQDFTPSANLSSTLRTTPLTAQPPRSGPSIFGTFWRCKTYRNWPPLAKLHFDKPTDEEKKSRCHPVLLLEISTEAGKEGWWVIIIITSKPLYWINTWWTYVPVAKFAHQRHMRKHKRLNLVGGGKLPGRERSWGCLNSSTPFPDDVFEPWRRDGDGRQYRLDEESVERVRELVRARCWEIVAGLAGLGIKKDDDVPFKMSKEEDDAVIISPILDALPALHVPPSEEINTSSYDRIQKLLSEYRASPLPPTAGDSRRNQKPNEDGNLPSNKPARTSNGGQRKKNENENENRPLLSDERIIPPSHPTHKKDWEWKWDSVKSI